MKTKRPKQSVCVKPHPPKTVKECAAIALAEFKYWDKGYPFGTGQTGVGAAANIYAAIAYGTYAPWHPKPKKGKKK